jgi:hypothetical protein
MLRRHSLSPYHTVEQLCLKQFLICLKRFKTTLEPVSTSGYDNDERPSPGHGELGNINIGHTSSHTTTVMLIQVHNESQNGSIWKIYSNFNTPCPFDTRLKFLTYFWLNPISIHTKLSTYYRDINTGRHPIRVRVGALSNLGVRRSGSFIKFIYDCELESAPQSLHWHWPRQVSRQDRQDLAIDHCAFHNHYSRQFIFVFGLPPSN